MKRSRYYRYPILDKDDIRSRRVRVNNFLRKQTSSKNGNTPWSLVLLFIAFLFVVIPFSLLNTILIFLGEDGFCPFVDGIALFLCGIVLLVIDGRLLRRLYKQRRE